jgi:hypothetical protein
MKVVGIYVRPYVILQGLNEGNIFFREHCAEEDPTRNAMGIIAHKVLGFADTIEQAQKAVSAMEHSCLRNSSPKN